MGETDSCESGIFRRILRRRIFQAPDFGPDLVNRREHIMRRTTIIRGKDRRQRPAAAMVALATRCVRLLAPAALALVLAAGCNKSAGGNGGTAAGGNGTSAVPR